MLHWAAFRRNLNVIAMVISAGKTQNPDDLNESNIVNLNVISHNQTRYHPIHWACKAGHQNVVELFLKLGVDINVQSSQNCTPLMMAIEKNHTDLAIYLQSKGADTNRVDSNGFNCLQWAAYVGTCE